MTDYPKYTGCRELFINDDERDFWWIINCQRCARIVCDLRDDFHVAEG
jgi:hypothetical protein